MTLQPNPERAAKGMWWDRAWSLVDGCTPVSAGCDHCWSRAMAERFGTGTRGAGDAVKFREDRLELPGSTRKPTVFAVWDDLFHEKVLDHEIGRAFMAMACNRRHLFIVLTKRPERMAEWSNRIGVPISPETCVLDLPDGWPPNVIVGTSVEDQATADKRIPELLKVRASCLAVSFEPALGPVDFSAWISQLGWVISGGETGHGARPCDARWIESACVQAQAAGVPFWFKSWGAKPTHLSEEMEVFSRSAGNMRREFPEVVL
jgi:protein gp37